MCQNEEAFYGTFASGGAGMRRTFFLYVLSNAKDYDLQCVCVEEAKMTKTFCYVTHLLSRLFMWKYLTAICAYDFEKVASTTFIKSHVY